MLFQNRVEGLRSDASVEGLSRTTLIGVVGKKEEVGKKTDYMGTHACG